MKEIVDDTDTHLHRRLEDKSSKSVRATRIKRRREIKGDDKMKKNWKILADTPFRLEED